MRTTCSRILVLSLLAIAIIFPRKTMAQLSQPSIAHVWINQALFSIRNDFARPPVHARNLFHLSTVMHDAWAALEPGKNTYFLGQELHGFAIPFEGFPIPSDSTIRAEQQKEALSHAAYRLLKHRFFQAPGAFFIYQRLGVQLFFFHINIFTSLNPFSVHTFNISCIFLSFTIT